MQLGNSLSCPFLLFSFFPSRASRAVGQCRIPSPSVASVDCLDRQSYASVNGPRRRLVSIDQSRCGGVSSLGGSDAVAASSIEPSDTSIRSSDNIISHRQVTVVDLGLVSTDARPAVGDHVSVGKYFIGRSCGLPASQECLRPRFRPLVLVVVPVVGCSCSVSLVRLVLAPLRVVRRLVAAPRGYQVVCIAYCSCAAVP